MCAQQQRVTPEASDYRRHRAPLKVGRAAEVT
ncbi:MAG: hypothetical protein ACI915_002401 [Gammaproteobacteria bacterium]|jgi:hypothetical protein